MNIAYTRNAPHNIHWIHFGFGQFHCIFGLLCMLTLIHFVCLCVAFFVGWIYYHRLHQHDHFQAIFVHFSFHLLNGLSFHELSSAKLLIYMLISLQIIWMGIKKLQNCNNLWSISVLFVSGKWTIPACLLCELKMAEMNIDSIIALFRAILRVRNFVRNSYCFKCKTTCIECGLRENVIIYSLHLSCVFLSALSAV